MPITQHHIDKKKVAAGAALVALSGFVPQPLMQQAHAASAAINVTGSFVTGVELAAGNAFKFGTIAATGAAGSVTFNPATGGGGTFASNNAVQINASSQTGSFSLKVASTTPDLNVTVAGLGTVTLIASGGGAGPTGSVKLAQVILDKSAFGAGADIVFASGGGTSDTAVIAGGAAAATTDILVGGQLTWTGGIPVGQFTQAITLTATF